MNFEDVPWRLASEPTGEKAENCSGIYSESDDSFWAFDVDCAQKMTPVCQNISFTFILRGLCPESTIDTVYVLNKTSDGGVAFLGYSGWNIKWHQLEKQWLITNHLYPGKYISKKEKVNETSCIEISGNLSITKYPIGSHIWTLSGEEGCFKKSHKRILSFSVCNSSQFACDSGHCVSMEKRQVVL